MYFGCKQGCYQCCPGGEDSMTKSNDKRMMVNLTIGDVYRAWKFNNPEEKKFSEIFNEQFSLGACSPYEPELNEMEKELESMGVIVVRKDPSADVFSVIPVSKSPCYQLNGGCDGHGTVSKYMTCVVSPEVYLLEGKISDKDRDEGKYHFFDCIMDMVLPDESRKRIEKVDNLHEREKVITGTIFPLVKVKGADNSSAIPYDALHTAGNFKQGLTGMMISFDDNRPWEEEISDITMQYADIMGFR